MIQPHMVPRLISMPVSRFKNPELCRYNGQWSAYFLTSVSMMTRSDTRLLSMMRARPAAPQPRPAPRHFLQARFSRLVCSDEVLGGLDVEYLADLIADHRCLTSAASANTLRGRTGNHLFHARQAAPASSGGQDAVHVACCLMWQGVPPPAARSRPLNLIAGSPRVLSCPATLIAGCSTFRCPDHNSGQCAAGEAALPTAESSAVRMPVLCLSDSSCFSSCATTSAMKGSEFGGTVGSEGVLTMSF